MNEFDKIPKNQNRFLLKSCCLFLIISLLKIWLSCYEIQAFLLLLTQNQEREKVQVITFLCCDAVLLLKICYIGTWSILSHFINVHSFQITSEGAHTEQLLYQQ